MDEHPIQGTGKSNGASIATETGIGCSHLCSIGLYCAFTLITLGFVVTVICAVTITGCHVARLTSHQEHPTSKGHLEFSGAFFLAEIFEKVSDPYNFRITRLSARKSKQIRG